MTTGTSFKKIAILICLFATIRLGYSATQTINTLPSADATFIATLQTFLGNEISNYIHLRYEDAIISGGTGSTDASLTHTIASIVGFPNGYYVTQTSTSHTYTASTRTYVYLRDSNSRTITIASAGITYDGYLVFATMVSGATRPTDPTGCLALMLVDTDGTSISTVYDLRFTNLSTISVNTIAELRSLTGDNYLFADPIGYYDASDGNGGPTRTWTSGASPATYVDNGGSIIVPYGGDGSAAWLTPWEGSVNVDLYGAKGDGSTDDTTAYEAAMGDIVTHNGGTLYFTPSKSYILGDTKIFSIRSGENGGYTAPCLGSVIIEAYGATITHGGTGDMITIVSRTGAGVSQEFSLHGGHWIGNANTRSILKFRDASRFQIYPEAVTVVGTQSWVGVDDTYYACGILIQNFYGGGSENIKLSPYQLFVTAGNGVSLMAGADATEYETLVAGTTVTANGTASFSRFRFDNVFFQGAVSGVNGQLINLHSSSPYDGWITRVGGNVSNNNQGLIYSASAGGLPKLTIRGVHLEGATDDTKTTSYIFYKPSHSSGYTPTIEDCKWTDYGRSHNNIGWNDALTTTSAIKTENYFASKYGYVGQDMSDLDDPRGIVPLTGAFAITGSSTATMVTATQIGTTIGSYIVSANRGATGKAFALYLYTTYGTAASATLTSLATDGTVLTLTLDGSGNIIGNNASGTAITVQWAMLPLVARITSEVPTK